MAPVYPRAEQGEAQLWGKVAIMAKAANRAPVHLPTLLGPKRTQRCLASSLFGVKS